MTSSRGSAPVMAMQAAAAASLAASPLARRPGLPAAKGHRQAAALGDASNSPARCKRTAAGQPKAAAAAASRPARPAARPVSQQQRQRQAGGGGRGCGGGQRGKENPPVQQRQNPRPAVMRFPIKAPATKAGAAAAAADTSARSLARTSSNVSTASNGDGRVRTGVLSQAVFAMGCFWHSEAVMGGVDGVEKTCVGFVGGVEVVRVRFDPGRVTMSQLIEFWRNGHEVGKTWANKKYASLVFAGCTQYAKAEEEAGKGAVRPLTKFVAAPEKDQLYYLRGRRPDLLKHGLADDRLCRINSAIAACKPYTHLVHSSALARWHDADAQQASVQLGMSALQFAAPPQRGKPVKAVPAAAAPAEVLAPPPPPPSINSWFAAAAAAAATAPSPAASSPGGGGVDGSFSSCCDSSFGAASVASEAESAASFASSVASAVSGSSSRLSAGSSASSSMVSDLSFESSQRLSFASCASSSAPPTLAALSPTAGQPATRRPAGKRSSSGALTLAACGLCAWLQNSGQVSGLDAVPESALTFDAALRTLLTTDGGEEQPAALAAALAAGSPVSELLRSIVTAELRVLQSAEARPPAAVGFGLKGSLKGASGRPAKRVRFCAFDVSTCGHPAAWTILQQYDPDHLGLLYNMLP